MQWDLVRFRFATHSIGHRDTHTHFRYSTFVCLVFADIYSRVLYCGIMDPNTPIQEKQFILREYNKYMSSPHLPLRVLCFVCMDSSSLIEQTHKREANLCPRVDTHRPYRLAHAPTAEVEPTDCFHTETKRIAKLLTTCLVMIELKKRTTFPSPAERRFHIQREDELYFSSLAAAIELLQQLTNKWGMYVYSCHLVFVRDDIIIMNII